MKRVSKKNRIRLQTGVASEQEIAFTKGFNSRVVGQVAASSMAGRAYRRALNPLRDPNRPIYVAFLLGEPGQGKTLTAEEIAYLLHGNTKAMIKINCGAYKEKHRISQLLGAPPSYVGYKDPSDPKEAGKPGQKDTSAKLSRQNIEASRMGSPVPVSVILLDEIEKMSEDLEDVLLSINDKGEVDMGNNTVADFTDCIILMAGNVGSGQVRKLSKRMGFTVQRDQEPTYGEIKDTIFEALYGRFKVEFVDRVDETVIYETLTAEAKRKIVDVEIMKLDERIMARLPRGLQFTLSVDAKAREFVLAEALKNKGSVRRVKRMVASLIEEPLGNELIKKSITLGDLIEVTHEEGETALSFYKSEGEGDVSEADRMVVSGPTYMPGLEFQRKVDRAIKKAAKGEKQLFEVTLEADSQAQLGQDTRDAINELTKVYGMSIVRTSNTWETPWVLTIVVRGIAEQVELFKSKNTLAKVTTLADSDEKATR